METTFFPASGAWGWTMTLVTAYVKKNTYYILFTEAFIAAMKTL